MCSSCQQHALPALNAGVNPRGLNSCEVWQTDVTYIMSFGRQRYVQVSVDTFSGAVYASAHTGEKSSDAMKHLVQAFSFLGIPKSIKTDNGPTYTSKEFRGFLQQWGVEHKTGIPYSPTGQAIMERTHQNLKRVLSQQHQSLKIETPQIQLSKAFFTLNFLNCTYENLNPLIVCHFRENCQLQLKAKAPVMVPLEKEHEQIACSEMPCQPCHIQGELSPAKEGEKQLRQQLEEPQENGQNMEAEAQAELPKAPSDIMAVKRSNKEDMRRTQDRWNLQQQRGDQQNQNSSEKMQAELQKTQARIKAVDKRLEAETEIQRETEEIINLLLEEQEALQKRVSERAIATAVWEMVSTENPQRIYTELENLGSGAFGVVCRAVDTATGREVAIKKINVQKLRKKQRIVNEIRMMKRNRSPCVVTYLDRELLMIINILLCMIADCAKHYYC
ncbi:hypothetical protein DUI87_12210 [Hirundo rustica rustica]|uniref:Integrase catalytic domain-containing protein n=1 Tax=Hirundo rustica rustica TaxID=333673 RepID=A0A3M0KCT0_HIRRU|nr:hypothetical protein DUI87_12210 [Hirundo rustica rustica]